MPSTAFLWKSTVVAIVAAAYWLALAPAAASGAPSTKPTPATLPANAKDVAFKADVDGTEQRYIIMLPEVGDANAPRDVLIALHGHGSDRMQFATQARDECRAARDAAATHGMIFVSPDYRATTSWMGPKAEADVVQIIGDLKKAHKVRRGFITGGSMGGTATLTFAALHPDLIDGAAAMNGHANHVEYAQFQDAIAKSFGGTKEEAAEEYRKRSAEFSAEKLTMPVACTTGGKDTTVPPESVHRLAKTLEELKRPVLLIHRPEGGHGTNYKDATAILDFVITHAKP